MRQFRLPIPRLQMDITKSAAAATTLAVDDNLDDTEIEQSEEELDDENLIRYYCYKGFQYKDIGMFLQRKRGQKMTLWTLKNGDPCRAMNWREGMHNMT